VLVVALGGRAGGQLLLAVPPGVKKRMGQGARVYWRGQFEPRAIWSTELRSVSSPLAAMMAFLAPESSTASAVARNLVPIRAPAAPRASAAATRRPSAIPPAARTGRVVT
jgi:hypothetical protein